MTTDSHLPERRRRRWAQLLASILTYATAVYLAYVATFIYFFTTPFHPNGPYGGKTCLQPHLLFGQICRDWSQRGTTSAARLGFGAVFLIGFLLLALAARRVVWVFLLIPFLTLPYVNVEHGVWISSVWVSCLAVAVIAGLQLVARVRPAEQFRTLPLSFLVAATGFAVVASILTSGPPVPSLSRLPGLASWPQTALYGIDCVAPRTCVATGELYSSTDSRGITLGMTGGRWGAPTSVLPRSAYDLEDLSCASIGNCIATEGVNSSYLLAQHHGWWGLTRGAQLPHVPKDRASLSTFTGCSPGGICWGVDEADSGTVRGSIFTPFKVPYAIGTVDGRWLPVTRIGPTPTERGRRDGWSEYVNGVSCWSSSSCTFTGVVLVGRSGEWRPFVQEESNGTFRPARWIPQTPNTAGLVMGSFPLFAPFSCSDRVDCLLGGYEMHGEGDPRAAVQQEVNGRWLAPVGLSGAPRTEPWSLVWKAACNKSAQLCVASGSSSANDNQNSLVFRAEVHGRWQPAFSVPTGDVNFSRPAAAACPTAATCYVVGWLVPTKHNEEFDDLAFVASYARGHWAFDRYALGHGEASTQLEDLSCSSTSCWAVGAARWAAGYGEGFAYPLSGVAH